MNEIVLVSSESEDEDRVLVVKSDNDDKDSNPQPVHHKHNLSYDATTDTTTVIHHQSSLSEDLSSHALAESDNRSEPSKTASISYTCQFLHCIDSSNVSRIPSSPILGRAASSSYARSHVRLPPERLQRTHCFSAARSAANPNYAQREWRTARVRFALSERLFPL